MFEHDFKEKETRTVDLKGKVYSDFLEFLLCLHPDVQKRVDNENVLSVVHLAEEYQAKLIIRKCKDVMSKWLQSEFQSARGSSTVLKKLVRVRTCLRILTTAETLQCNEIVEAACKVIGRFGHALFTGTVTEDTAYKVFCPQTGIYKTVKPLNEDPLADCNTLFENLPEQLKYILIIKRLGLCDNLEMR